MLYKYIQIDITYKTILSLRLILLFPAVQSYYLVQLCLENRRTRTSYIGKEYPNDFVFDSWNYWEMMLDKNSYNCTLHNTHGNESYIPLSPAVHYLILTMHVNNH